MKELYDIVRELDPGHDSFVVTLLEGQYCGVKALLCGGAVTWCSGEEAFFAEQLPALVGIKDTGIQVIGGRRLYAERFGREKQVVICGAGHVGTAITRAAKFIGLRVTVVDDRPQFADAAREAGADKVICSDFTEALEEIPGGGDCYFVIVTRGHRSDQVCLQAIAKKPHAYIGLMGSRRKVKLVKEALMSEGISGEVLDRVCMPIGLDIGGETPEEIAVSVAAEIIEVKNRKQKQYGYSEDILDAVTGDHHHEALAEMRKILATIISRKGSAPRDVGTKMLVLEDGSCIGTIGGGRVEADVIRKCRELLLTDTPQAELFHADLTAEAAGEEGMVCGGVLEVLLERVQGESRDAGSV